MNAILESPVLEALVFNYLSFNVVWTWVAVFTVAVSFWRIKASSSSSQVERLLSKENTSLRPARNAAFLVTEERTKGKLTVYFKQDADGVCNRGDHENEDEGVELSKEWFQNWEKLRKGEMGWYSYQDMKVIDGSVVRLWDGRREAQKNLIF